jgi:hypothetical protein
MFEKFGEFDSAEELNAKAEELKQDFDSLKILAKENGLDELDAEDFYNGDVQSFTTPAMAAVGKLNAEAEEMKLQGVLADWKDSILELCIEENGMEAAVRKKGKNLCDCMAQLMRFAFNNKVQVPEQIVKATKVTHNGKEEAMRGPVYLGIPTRKEVKEIVRKYYLGGK